DLESADRSAGEQADDHDHHRGDEAAERPAEDGDDAMLLGAAPAAPHQKRDHAHGGRAAKHARGCGEEPVNVALPFREGDGRWKWSHLFISDLTQAIPTPFAEIRGLSDVSDSCLQRFPDSPIRFASHPIKERLIGWAALGEAEISLALERLEGAQQHGLTAGSLLV